MGGRERGATDIHVVEYALHEICKEISLELPVPYFMQFGEKILGPLYGEKNIEYVHNIKCKGNNGEASYSFLVLTLEIQQPPSCCDQHVVKEIAEKENLGYHPVIGNLLVEMLGWLVPEYCVIHLRENSIKRHAVKHQLRKDYTFLKKDDIQKLYVENSKEHGIPVLTRVHMTAQHNDPHW